MTQFTATDLFSQDFKRNPFPALAYLRTEEPIFRFTMPNGLNAWLVARYDDALAILKDQRFTKNVWALFPEEELQRMSSSKERLASARILGNHMLAKDPPDHTRLRNLVSKAFTPRMIEQMRDRIQQITDELLDAVEEKGRMELIGDFAFPLPIIVISELLGIPVADRDKFRVWSNAIVSRQGFFQSAASSSAEIEDFIAYVRALIAKKRAHPTGDLVSALVQVDEAGDKLSENELISMIVLLIVAGHETTVNLIGSGTLALLQHPEQWRKLQEDPSLIPSAVEELLRYTSPVALATARFAMEDIEFAGKTIEKGNMVLVCLMAADTDPKHFADAETLDVTRQENKHLAFGKGIHFCLGAPLARLEGQIAFSTLLRRMPALRLDADPDTLTWRPSMILRGLESLPVTFS